MTKRRMEVIKIRDEIQEVCNVNEASFDVNLANYIVRTGSKETYFHTEDDMITFLNGVKAGCGLKLKK